MTENEIEQLLSLANMHMQSTYAATLGESPWAHDIASKLGSGYRHAIRSALRDMGLDR